MNLPPAGSWRCQDGVVRLYDEMSDADVIRACWILGGGQTGRDRNGYMGALGAMLLAEMLDQARARGIEAQLPAYLRSTCDLCPGKAIFRVGLGAFCRTHKDVAVARRAYGAQIEDRRSAAYGRHLAELDKIRQRVAAHRKGVLHTVTGRHH